VPRFKGDFEASESELAAAVVDEGENGMADGLVNDSQDRIYITVGEHDLLIRAPTTAPMIVSNQNAVSFKADGSKAGAPARTDCNVKKRPQDMVRPEYSSLP
jgi:hypothetical protein